MCVARKINDWALATKLLQLFWFLFGYNFKKNQKLIVKTKNKVSKNDHDHVDSKSSLEKVKTMRMTIPYGSMLEGMTTSYDYVEWVN